MFLRCFPPPPPAGCNSPPVGQALLSMEASRSHPQTHLTRYESSGRGISPMKRPLHHNTQHSQETDIHAPRFEPAIPGSQQPQTHAFRPRVPWDRPRCNTLASKIRTAELKYPMNVISHCSPSNNTNRSVAVYVTCCEPFGSISGNSLRLH